MPSSKKARHAVIQLSEETGIGPIYELGSGWGSLLIPLAKKYPYRKIVGYELSVMPWFMSVILIKALGLSNVQVYRQNFIDADLSRASVIVCYLFLRGMQDLEDKLSKERGRAEFLISNNFALPSHKPTKTIQLNDLYHSPIYLYNIK
jgi:hypothetical protein